MTARIRPARTTGRRVVLVAAVADNGVIGLDADMPWHVPADLARFRAVTTGHAVVMGRRTFETIGRPLPNRVNVVVTRDIGWTADGVLVAHSVEDAIARAAEHEGDVMVVGGAQVYAAAMAHADVQLLTEVHTSPAGDTFYPEFAAGEWVEVERERHEGFDFVRLERR